MKSEAGAHAAQLEAPLQELLTSLVGHDLRNSLAAISTSAGVLERLTGDEPARRCAEVIVSSSARMNRLIADLCDLLTAAGSGIPLRPSPAHLDAICQSVIRRCQDAHPVRQISCQGHGDGLGRWDAPRLTQLLHSLVDNALRHGAAQSVVQLRWDGSQPARVWVEVENRGPTIPAESLAELCSLFRRGRRPSSERDGLGVGLFLADHLARAHGGSLRLSSAEEQTVARLELPRESP